MNQTQSILALMKQDHHNIESLLDALDEHLDASSEEIKQYFERFEWNLEKHLFIEEKAIFTFYEPEDLSQGYKMVPTVITQHNYILNELKNMRKIINTGKIPTGLDEFKSFLMKHRNYEERDVYPKLEEELTDEQKKVIINRINEIR